jgi:branched-chain amino acid transport system substrate-binding protein
MKQFLASVVLLLLILAACAPNQEKSEEIRIGFYGPLSGDMASFGNTVKRGIELGVEEVNKGELRGKRFKLFVEDDRGNPEEAQSAVSRLINRDRVVAILGEPSSSCSLAGAPICQQFRVPMITPAATNVKVTQQGDFIFRVCWTDNYQGEVMGQFAVQDLKAKNLAVLVDVSSDYSTGLADVFTNKVESIGGRVVTRESYNAGDTNFAAQLTSIINQSPDALFLPVYYNEAGLILRQLRSMNSSIVVIGADGWDSPFLRDIGGDALNGTFYCTHFLPSDPAPTVQKFVAAYRSKHNAEPSMGEALGYDSIRLLADAMMRSSFTDREKIRDAIAATKNFHGVTGEITIDSARNARKPLILVKMENGEAKLYRKLEAATGTN